MGLGEVLCPFLKRSLQDRSAVFCHPEQKCGANLKDILASASSLFSNSLDEIEYARENFVV
jgi:hypothetical protein